MSAFLGTILGGTGQFGYTQIKATEYAESLGKVEMKDAAGFSCAIASVVLQILTAVAYFYEAKEPQLALKTPDSQVAGAV